jgi:hypothetical protein
MGWRRGHIKTRISAATAEAPTSFSLYDLRVAFVAMIDGLPVAAVRAGAFQEVQLACLLLAIRDRNLDGPTAGR